MDVLTYSDSNAWIPTLPLVWTAPFTCFPSIYTNKFVISKICKGANLMHPGVIPVPEYKDYVLGQIVSIHDYENPYYAYAIGYLEKSGIDLLIGTNSGCAVTIVHYLNDNLQKKTFSKNKNLDVISLPVITDELKSKIPNPFNRIITDNQKIINEKPLSSTFDKDLISDTESIISYETLGSEFTTSTSKNEWVRIDSDGDIQESVSNYTQTLNSEIPDEEASQESGEDNKDSSDSPDKIIKEQILVEDMDKLMLDAFLLGIKKNFAKESFIPISHSIFYSKYIIKNGRGGKEINVKYSSFKKLSNWFKHLNKIGLINLTVKKNDSIIKSVNLDHILYKNFVPYKVTSIDSTSKETSSNIKDTNHSSNEDKFDKFLFIECYLPKQILVKEIFTDIPDGVIDNSIEEILQYCLTKEDITLKIKSFINDKNMKIRKGKESFVSLKDSELKYAFESTEIELNEFISNVIKKCTKYCFLNIPNWVFDKVDQGTIQLKRNKNFIEVPLKIIARTSLTSKEYNKTISEISGTRKCIQTMKCPSIKFMEKNKLKKFTLVSGLESVFINSEEFSQILRKKLSLAVTTGVGETIERDPSVSHDTLLIQGFQSERLYKLLESFGVGREFITLKAIKGK